MWPDGRWHYRRSLASRVAVLTTVALGVSIAVLAVTAFVVMRQQLMSSLDQSLLNRAHKATADTDAVRAHRRRRSPRGCWARPTSGSSSSPPRAAQRAPTSPTSRLGQPEYDVVTGQRESVVRTLVTEEGERFRVATVQAGSGQALVLAQPLAPNDRTLEQARRRALRLRRARRARRPARRLAGGPQRPADPYAASRSAVERIAVTEDLTPLRVEGDDEVARLATAFNQMLLALGASRDRQRRLVADASHELRTPADLAAHQPRPAPPGRGQRGAAAGGAARAARRRTRPDRGAQRAGRRPGRAGPRRADDPRGRARSTSPRWSSGR